MLFRVVITYIKLYKDTDGDICFENTGTQAVVYYVWASDGEKAANRAVEEFDGQVFQKMIGESMIDLGLGRVLTLGIRVQQPEFLSSELLTHAPWVLDRQL